MHLYLGILIDYLIEVHAFDAIFDFSQWISLNDMSVALNKSIEKG